MSIYCQRLSFPSFWPGIWTHSWDRRRGGELYRQQPITDECAFTIFFYFLDWQELLSRVINGLIMGLAMVPIIKFRSRSGVLRAELFVIISILVPTLLFKNWFPTYGTADQGYYLDYISRVIFRDTLPFLALSLIIIPISMIAYSFILAWIKKNKKISVTHCQ